jgi:stage II sporulation protein D
MIEPHPREVPLPEKAEFTVRIAVVLAEDKKQKLCFRIPKQSYIAEGEGREIPLESGHLYTLENKDGAMRLSGQSVQNILVSREFISLAPQTPTALAPQAGLPIQGIRAGRGFHWEQEIVEIFPGRIEVHACGKYVLVINELSFEDYLACVAVSEMSNECPPEFLKVQAIVARSWGYCFLGVKYPGKSYDLCNDDMSQRYQGSTFLTDAALSAIRETSGQYLITTNAKVCAAYYSKICGGRSEVPESVFGFPVEGVQSIFDGEESHPATSLNLKEELNVQTFLHDESLTEAAACGLQKREPFETSRYLGGVDIQSEYFRWQLRYTRSELLELLQEKGLLLEAHTIQDLKITQRGVSGRAVECVIVYQTGSKEIREYALSSQFEIRKTFHSSFLFSSQFIVQRDVEGNFILVGGGWGHGVGLCQVGALNLALQGKNAAEIAKHYFPACHIEKCQ